MKRARWTLLTVSGWLVAAGIASASWPPGNLLHPMKSPRPEVLMATRCLPAEARDHVYIFLVNGIDPGNICNFRGLYDYLIELGYCNTYFGQMWDCAKFKKKMREIRSCDPQARIVLLGYSAGANCVRHMAHSLQEDGTQIDLLIYLAGDTLCNTEHSRPTNACKIVNIRAWGLVFLAGGIINGANLDGCDNYDIGFVRHSCVPSNVPMLELLAREFYILAASVCAPAPVTPAP